jgi:dihydrofolate reductase
MRAEPRPRSRAASSPPRSPGCAQPSGEIIAWGGAGFAQSLSRAGLIDEYILVIKPAAYGGGLPLFRDLPEALQLDLIEARTFDCGVVLHRYEPASR